MNIIQRISILSERLIKNFLYNVWDGNYKYITEIYF